MGRVRSRGEGSISKRKDGRFEIRLSLGTENGKRRRAFLYAKTRADAVKLLSQARQDQRPGRIPGARTGETLEHFLARWLEDHVAKTKRPGTVASYEQNIRTYINPVIGKVRLTALTREHVEQVQNNASALGLSPSTVRLVRVILGAALKRAEMWEVPGARNVVRLTDGPKLEPRQQKFLDPDQARSMLRAVKGKRLEAFWMLALFGGLRLGELQGLRWQDIDTDRRQLRVAQTYKTPSRGLEPLKTKTSYRVVDLPDVVVAALKGHRLRQIEEQVNAGGEGVPWLNEWGLVFTGHYGSPTSRTELQKLFRRLLREAGLSRIRIHDLRHSYATLELAAGVSPKVVQESLGHARIGTTLDLYAHVIPAARREAAEALERLLG
jgi:integrase